MASEGRMDQYDVSPSSEAISLPDMGVCACGNGEKQQPAGVEGFSLLKTHPPRLSHILCPLSSSEHGSVSARQQQD